ncbi:acetate kinase [Paludibacterium paludis]|uniref:Acetate kinase n=1 Tax=Paludibacterium paludis TaxID=1225769 RepID=A0A918P6K8_9NEIS|nr:acetate kinase [Paludibacterium paludis]GGY26431.1 acetate kinase [Paludibacterium paludis]
MNPSILVINCGSSSLKFALTDPRDGSTPLSGLAEKLGLADASITFRHDGEKNGHPLQDGTHSGAMKAIIDKLDELGLADAVAAVGHRIVHGGERFKESILIDEDVILGIGECSRLAPLHNPGHLLGIRSAMESFPALPQVAVFDTAFHQTLPERAYRYALPASLYHDHAVRRYGFHGTSYRFVSTAAVDMLGKPLEETAMVCAHLGNGASAAAVLGGRSVDTSMGLTPLEGLVMGSRSGDIDPGLFNYLASALDLDTQGVTDLLNRQSGLLGLSGLSNDCRELEIAAANGHEAARLALDIFCYRLAKYIAALVVPMGRIDALVFTGGIGENSAAIRAQVIGLLGFLGFELDSPANERTIRGKAGRITTQRSVPALVINTNEEDMIARDTARLAGLAA